MGLLDRFIPGGAPTYKQPQIELKGVVGVWSAARTGAGGLSLTGGQVVLARDYLVFSPWDMDRTRAWLVQWLGKAGVPQVATVDKLLAASRLLEPVVLSLAEISDVQVLNRASLLKPPQARLFFRDGRHFDLGILHSPTTPNFSGKNNAAFDDWLSNMRAAAGGLAGGG